MQIINTDKLKELGFKDVKQEAKKEGIRIDWGGDWKDAWDRPQYKIKN